MCLSPTFLFFPLLTRYSHALGVYVTVVICLSVCNGCIVAKR